MSDVTGCCPLNDVVDTGFDAVFAGEKYEHPEPEVVDDPHPSIIIKDAEPATPHECVNTHGGTRCDICFGEITATVTLTEEGKQAAKALVQLPPLDWPTLARLAREIAMDIKERGTLLAEYKLNATQYEYLEAYNEFYRSALAASCKEWHAPLATSERLKIEAAAILEDGMVGLGARMQSRSEGLPGVIEAAKFFAKVAGVGEREAGAGAPGERFTINIDLGGDQKIVVQAAPQAAQPVGADSSGSIRQDPQTHALPGPLPSIK